MAKDFNVYKWRREHLVENTETKTPKDLFAAFKEKFDTGFHREDQNLIKTISRYAQIGRAHV